MDDFPEAKITFLFGLISSGAMLSLAAVNYYGGTDKTQAAGVLEKAGFEDVVFTGKGNINSCGNWIGTSYYRTSFTAAGKDARISGTVCAPIIPTYPPEVIFKPKT